MTCVISETLCPCRRALLLCLPQQFPHLGIIRPELGPKCQQFKDFNRLQAANPLEIKNLSNDERASVKLETKAANRSGIRGWARRRHPPKKTYVALCPELLLADKFYR